MCRSVHMLQPLLFDQVNSWSLVVINPWAHDDNLAAYEP